MGKSFRYWGALIFCAGIEILRWRIGYSGTIWCSLYLKQVPKKLRFVHKGLLVLARKPCSICLSKQPIGPFWHACNYNNALEWRMLFLSTFSAQMEMPGACKECRDRAVQRRTWLTSSCPQSPPAGKNYYSRHKINVLLSGDLVAQQGTYWVSELHNST